MIPDSAEPYDLDVRALPPAPSISSGSVSTRRRKEVKERIGNGPQRPEPVNGFF
jgi:hypothetical protein